MKNIEQQPFDPIAHDNEVRAQFEEYNKKEQEKLAKIQRMFALARDVGSDMAVVEQLREMRFETWQDALDFKAFCEENDLPVKLVEPPTWDKDQIYRVFPV